MESPKKPAALARPKKGVGFVLAPSAAEEPAWLGEPKGSPVSKGLAEQWIRAAAEAYGTAAESEARAAHVVGTYFLELHAHAAWKLFPDCKGLPDLLVNHVGVPVSTAYRYMQFAKVCTLEQAGWGIDKAKAGHVIAAQVGLEKFDDLLDAKKMQAKLGRAFDFKRLTAGQLEQIALGLVPKALPPSAVLKKDSVRARQYREVITGLVEKHPALAALHPKVRMYDGAVGVRHEPAESRDEMLGLIAMYRELVKL